MDASALAVITFDVNINTVMEEWIEHILKIRLVFGNQEKCNYYSSYTYQIDIFFLLPFDIVFYGKLLSPCTLKQ